MTESGWHKLLAALADAGLEYPELHRLLAAFFSARCCGLDSDWLADVTLDHLAHQLEVGAPVQHLVPYARGIARHVYCAYCEDRKAFREAAGEIKYLAGEGLQDPEERPDLRRRCQKSCLRSLSEPELKLMVDYLLSGRSRRELAEERGWSLGKLYVRVYRIRQRLDECVQECRRVG